MKHFLIGLFLVSCSFSLLAASGKNGTFKGYLSLKDGVKRYTEYTPAKAGKPTIVLVNGLVYELSRWDTLRNAFLDKGYGTINYYMRGQYKTLIEEVKSSPNKEPSFFSKGISLSDLGEELNGVLEGLKISGPVVVIGLSYGAAAAAEFVRLHPEKIHAAFFMSPLVVPLDHYAPQGSWVYNSLDWIRLWWGDAAYDMAYNVIYSSYFNSSLIPDKIPDEFQNDQNVYKKAIFHLVRATREFDLRTYGFKKAPAHGIHFILANETERQAFQDQLDSFLKTETKSRGSLVWLDESDHAIPDSKPEQAAEMIIKILDNDRGLGANKLYRFNSKGLEEFKP